jgi:hypothetical protein
VHSLRKTGMRDKGIALILCNEHDLPTASRKYTTEEIRYMLYKREPHSSYYSLPSLGKIKRLAKRKVAPRRNKTFLQALCDWFK